MSFTNAYNLETALMPDASQSVSPARVSGRQLRQQLPGPMAVNYHTQRREMDRAYVVGARLVMGQREAKRAVDAIVELSEHIDRTEFTNPATYFAVRGIEEVFQVAVGQLLQDYMRGRVS